MPRALLNRHRVVFALAKAPFLVLVYAHLVALLSQFPAAPGAAALIAPYGRRGTLFVQSLLMSVIVALLCLTIGSLAARRLCQSRGPVAVALRPLTFAFAFLPAYIHCYGWSPFFAAWRGTWSPGSLPSLAASIWVQTMALLPLGVLLAILGWESFEPALLDAARVARPPAVVWREIVLPHSRPVLASAGGLLFVLSLLDYSIPSLFSVSTYSMEIFTQFGANPSAPHAVALALPLVFVAVIVLLISQGPFRRITLGHGGPPLAAGSLQSGRIGLLLETLALLILALQAAVAIGCVFSVSHPLSAIGAAWSSAREQIIFTFALALLTALLSTPIALPLALAMCSSGWRGRIWWAVGVCPLAVPASLTGVGFIALWNRPGLELIYDSPGILVLVWLARFLPLAALLLAAFISRVDTLLLDAGYLFGPTWVRRWLGVQLPLFGPGLLAAAALVFAMSVGEIGASLIVAPPGRGTMSMRIYSYLHAGARDTAAGLCVIQMIAVLAAAALVLRLARRQEGSR